MNKLRFLTAGESHGPALTIIVEGIPANLHLLPEHINQHLKRRQGGYGRGARMKIETDQIEFLGGIRHGYTMGGPISMLIKNKDYLKWDTVMNPEPVDTDDPAIKEKLAEKYISKVRPGHADYPASIKYSYDDVRNALERSSARETTSRVAAGSIARQLLESLGIEIYSHVIRIGSVSVAEDLCGDMTDKEWLTVEQSDLRCKDAESASQMRTAIDQARKAGESLGGVVEIIAKGLPVGLGSHVHWDRRLDGLIAQALMSVHTAKSVSFGLGGRTGELPGSEVHDQLEVNTANSNASMRYHHLTNRAGGIEGGISNGENIVCQVTLKPIPTLARRPEDALRSIDLASKENALAFYERSDVCVVPAGGVVCESMLALALADQLLYKFGGDSLTELRVNYGGYLGYCKNR